MYPIVTFDSVKVVGSAENAVVFKDNNVTFKAITNMPGEYRPVYKFWAFDEMTERIKRLKLKSGEWVTITAFMKERIDDTNTVRQSYTILAIDRVHATETKPVTKLEEKPEKGKEESNPIAEPKGFCNLDSFQERFGR